MTNQFDIYIAKALFVTVLAFSISDYLFLESYFYAHF
jgi:hypothetical protein